jgi:putative nucleotidyltransferase with HDIG domain
MNTTETPYTIPYLVILQKIAKSSKVKVFLVGGALRNVLLGQDNTDFDFATSKKAIAIARIFAKKIHGAFVLLDEEHHCARVARKEKGKLLTFDFADFRAKGLKGDLAHRDFTVNALAIDIVHLPSQKPLEKILIDVHHGLKHLRAKKIKMVSSKAFVEDPLRMVRAFSLKAVFGFSIEPQTLLQIKKDIDSLSQVARERVRDELFKVLSSSNAFENLKAMHRVKLLEKIIPQISMMQYLPQGGYHHLSLLNHSFETVRQLEKLLPDFKREPKVKAYCVQELAFGRSRESLLKFAALLHDIGKPETCRKEKGKMSFHGHEHSGRYIVRNVAKMLKLSSLEKDTLEAMVLHHLRPAYLSNFKTPTPRAIFRYFRDSGQEAMSVLLLSLADQRSTKGPLSTKAHEEHHEKIIRKLLDEHLNKKEVKKHIRLLTGDDLIKTLKLKPSPIFKKILTAVDEKQALGEITTKPEALEVARRIAK